MKQIKRLIVINLILALLLPCIPKGKVTITYETRVIELAEVVERAEELVIIEKNLGLSLDTNLRHLSNLSATDYDTMLQDTNLYGIGSALEKAEQQYNINGLYLMGLCILESGWRD